MTEGQGAKVLKNSFGSTTVFITRLLILLNCRDDGAIKSGYPMDSEFLSRSLLGAHNGNLINRKFINCNMSFVLGRVIAVNLRTYGKLYQLPNVYYYAGEYRYKGYKTHTRDTRPRSLL